MENKLASSLESLGGGGGRNRHTEHLLKRSRGLMVSGLVPYRPDLPPSAGLGREGTGSHETGNVCNNSNNITHSFATYGGTELTSPCT